MADRLTQLQDCLDNVGYERHQAQSVKANLMQLLEQMHKSLFYIQTRHPYGEIDGQPSQAPEPVSISVANSSRGVLTNGDSTQHVADPAATPPPEAPDDFNFALQEMAKGLVLKEQQIEYLINSLPGIGSTETDQERRMRALEVDLRQVEKERAKAEEEKERLADLLGQLIVGAKRVH